MFVKHIINPVAAQVIISPETTSWMILKASFTARGIMPGDL